MYRNILYSFLILTQLTLADSVTQTDWSDGAGVQGPVTAWESAFYTSDSVAWRSIPGQCTLSLILNSSSTEHFVAELYRANCVDCADIDGDGDTDISAITAAWGPQWMWWYENVDGSGTTWSGHHIEAAPGGAEAYLGDIDSDGDPDFVIFSMDQHPFSWWRNPSDPTSLWDEILIDDTLHLPTRGLIHDMDSDGDQDIIVTGHFPIGPVDQIVLFSNEGFGIKWSYSFIGIVQSSNYFPKPGDVDGDGDCDIATGTYSALTPQYFGSVDWWENQGLLWTRHNIDSLTSAMRVELVDLDSDGDLDLTCGSLFPPGIGVFWWENGGSGVSWTKHDIDPQYSMTCFSDFSDIDGDGDFDLVVSSYQKLYQGVPWGEREITIFENADGSGTSWIRYAVASNRDYSSLRLADIDGNGSLDIAGSANQDNGVYWWNVSNYRLSGNITSAILDTQCNPQWASFEWTALEPWGMDLYFIYRTSDNPDSMGTWEGPLYEPCELSGILKRYFQYRAVFESSNPDYSPILYDVSLNWDPTGIQGGSAPGLINLSCTPSPFSSSLCIDYTAPDDAQPTLSIYDISGRLIEDLVSEVVASGAYSETWNPASSIPNGCYLIVLDACGERVVRRAVLLR